MPRISPSTTDHSAARPMRQSGGSAKVTACAGTQNQARLHRLRSMCCQPLVPLMRLLSQRWPSTKSGPNCRLMATEVASASSSGSPWGSQPWAASACTKPA